MMFHRPAKVQKYFWHTLEFRDIRTLKGEQVGYWLIKKGGRFVDRALTRASARRRIKVLDAANA